MTAAACPFVSLYSKMIIVSPHDYDGHIPLSEWYAPADKWLLEENAFFLIMGNSFGLDVNLTSSYDEALDRVWSIFSPGNHRRNILMTQLGRKNWW